MTFIFCLCYVSTASSAKAKIQKQQKQPPMEGGIESLHLSGAPLGTIEDVIAHFETIDKNMTSLSADFKQSVVTSGAGVSQSVWGTLAYLKPDRIHLEHKKPENQTVVSDGKDIWIHRKDRNQVVQANFEDWKKSDPLINNLLDSVGNYSDLLKRYQVYFDSETLQISLSPKNDKKEFVFNLYLSGPAAFPMKTELKVAQMTVETVFENARFNPELKEKEFSFTPPTGAEVFRDFKPPQRQTPAPGGRRP